MFFYVKGNVKNVLKKESIKKIAQIVAKKNAQIVARKKIDKQIQNKKIKQKQELFDLYD